MEQRTTAEHTHCNHRTHVYQHRHTRIQLSARRPHGITKASSCLIIQCSFLQTLHKRTRRPASSYTSTVADTSNGVFFGMLCRCSNSAWPAERVKCWKQPATPSLPGFLSRCQHQQNFSGVAAVRLAMRRCDSSRPVIQSVPLEVLL